MVLRNESPPAFRPEAGLSLVEALISVGLIFIIAAGVLPLFARAMVSNHTGALGSKTANAAREMGEFALSANFDDPSFDIPAGQTLLTIEDRWITSRLATDTAPEDEVNAWDGAWYRETPGPSQVPTDRFEDPRLTRRTGTRQYGIGQWTNQFQPLDPADALPGDALVPFVQMKTVEIEVSGLENIILTGQRPARVRLLKAF